MTTFDVAETFTSINGEGTHAGQLAVFVRFAAAICSARSVIPLGQTNRMSCTSVRPQKRSVLLLMLPA